MASQPLLQVRQVLLVWKLFRILVLRGVHVVMNTRNTTAGSQNQARNNQRNPKAKIDCYGANVASLKSVIKFVTEFKASGLPLNILI
ncbi:putative very-long-chain 3-oxoacyl-CoA reductase [Helianthus annuus]|nr:putative very-long-chain 3-oxoacyl-CoA reductase [Helianthus annuus]